MGSDSYIFKVCILGQGGVGKSTLIHRYTTGSFKEDMKMTIGVNFHVKKITVNDINVSLQIWDFGGEERFRTLAPRYFDGAYGGILMYDITRYSSFKHSREWLDVLELNSEKMEELPIILVGGKLDLKHKRIVKMSVGQALAKDKNFHSFFECSSKTGENVNIVFEILTRAILERVIMLSTGSVEGNIITPVLVMEDGVVFDGNCTINKKVNSN